MHNSTSSSIGWKLGLATFGLFVCSVQPASATTYLFSIPESTLLSAFDTLLGVSNQDLFAGYEINIRPIQSAD